MTKIINLNKHRDLELRIVRTNDEQEQSKLSVALASAMNSLNAAQTWPEHKKTHLLNCRDALDRASFYLNDELKTELEHSDDR